jgi:hypothetical protein
MEEKTTKTRKQRSLSKDAPLGEVFTNRIKSLESVFDETYDLEKNHSDSKSGNSSPASPAIKKSHKKTPANQQQKK